MPFLPAVLIGAAASLGSSAIASSGQRKAAKNQEQLAQSELELKKQIIAQILPFAQQLMSLGIDPIQFMQSPLGQSILKPAQEATSRNFEQARVNLVDTLGGRGFSPSSGIAAGPLASLFGQEAAAQSNLVSQLPMQGLQIGLQGASLAAGQSPNIGQIGSLFQQAGQPNAFQQALANLPVALGSILGNKNP